MGIDAAGTAVAIWRRHDGSKYIVQAAVRAPGGPWTGAVDISAAGESADEPELAVSPGGEAIAVWTRFNGFRDIVQAAIRPAGGAWSAADDLSEMGENAREPEVAADPAGNAVAVWSRFDGSRFIAEGSRRPAGGGWEPALDISTAGQNAENPRVAIDGAGTAVAVWSRSDGSDLIVQGSVKGATGPWSGPADLSAAGEDAVEPQVAVDPGGNAVAVWARQNSPTKVIQSARLPAGGGWEPALTISRPGESSEEPDVALDPTGTAVAIWSRTDGSPRVIEAATRRPGALWGGPELVSVIGLSATDPRIALDPAGDRVAIWARDDGSNTIAQAAGYDGAGPLLRSLSMPTAGTVHRPLTYSVSLFDTWSTVGPVSWSFGDGEGDSGNAVTHSYAKPGTYQVAVTGVDELTNTTSASATVRIYPKPRAGRNVRVRGRRAILRLYCPSPAGCDGAIRLVAPTSIKRNGRPKGERRQIGRASFAIPGSKTSEVPVRLTRKGGAAVAATGRKGLKAQLTGPGAKHRIVVLYGRPRR